MAPFAPPGYAYVCPPHFTTKLRPWSDGQTVRVRSMTGFRIDQGGIFGMRTGATAKTE